MLVEKLAVFDTILMSMIPQVLGKETCMNVNVVITDGDSQEIKACNMHVNQFSRMLTISTVYGI